MAHVDGTRPVREGEQLDAGKLGEYLRGALGGDASVGIEQFPGGHSNLTYLIRYGEKELVLRRPPFGSKVKSAHDMGREFRVLSKLSAAYARAPRPIAHCDDPEVLGVEFYIMERVRGVIIRKDPPAGLAIDPQTATALCEVLVDTLAELHAIDYEAIGLGDFGRPTGYVERQVSGWTKRYAGSKTDDIDAVDQVAKWLADNLPEAPGASLIHNDFKFDNLVLDENDITKVVGILDWEMSTVGSPLMDLGTSLSYWVQANDPAPLQAFRFGPTTLPGMLTRTEVVARYRRASGRDIPDVLFYYCFGLFKTAVVAQQIYYRFVQGLTKDPRFAQMIHGVRLLAEMALHAVDTGSLEPQT